MKDSKPLPSAVRHLILAKIDSVWHLEILLHLYASRPRFICLSAISRALRIDEEPLFEQLRELQSRGLAGPSPKGRMAYAYFSASPEQDEAIEALARAYEDRPVSIMTSCVSSRGAGQKSAPALSGTRFFA